MQKIKTPKQIAVPNSNYVMVNFGKWIGTDNARRQLFELGFQDSNPDDIKPIRQIAPAAQTPLVVFGRQCAYTQDFFDPGVVLFHSEQQKKLTRRERVVKELRRILFFASGVQCPPSYWFLARSN